ncbi:hypothetical protein [Algibacillus agarilyticus]|uniref:hypothetical protein n=1 Tax=Algibacillus agarilyticus TaxID=2234133 RepID=UPI000DD069D5|nr:hypothetical protein [Algibacillus agarilyticus]
MFNIDYMTQREFTGILIGFVLALTLITIGLLGSALHNIQIIEMPSLLSTLLISAGIACFAKGLFILLEPLKTTKASF